MTRALQSLFVLLATATDRQLAKYVEYLKAENRVLRDRLPKRITLTPRERNRLVKAGRPLGSAIKDLITIVSPRTFLRWAKGSRHTPNHRTRRPGRPRTAESIRDLVLRIASETGWGYTRILGELKKLGIQSVSRSTVVGMLKEAGLDPGPRRGEGSWSDFLRRHAATIWACDFVTKKVWTVRGPVDLFVLVFLHLGSRRVHVAGISANPTQEWVAQQARNVAMRWDSATDRPQHLIRDMDTKFGGGFDAVMASEGVRVIRVGPRAPNLNAHCERWIQSLRHECLDHFVVFGESHLRHVVNEYVAHYLDERPHQSLGNRPPCGTGPPPGKGSAESVVCQQRLGGLLKHYRRAA